MDCAWQLPRNLDCLQDRVDHFSDFNAFHLKLRPQQHAMLKHGTGKCFYVLGQHEIALLESCKTARGLE